MVLSPILIEEVRRSLNSTRLRRAYGHSEADVRRWCLNLERSASVFTRDLPDVGQIWRDPDDDHVIATAIAVGATAIVTGDKDLLVLEQAQSVRIVAPRSFLDALE